MAVEHELDLITVAEAAQILRVSEVTVRRWLKQGRLRAYHVGPRAVRLRREELTNLLQPMATGLPVESMHRVATKEPWQPRRLTEEEVRRGLAAIERARKHMAEMRAARGGLPLDESWPIIRAAREDPARHW